MIPFLCWEVILISLAITGWELRLFMINQEEKKKKQRGKGRRKRKGRKTNILELFELLTVNNCEVIHRYMQEWL